jgi:uncharacterized coiled-coil protein SlyX
VSAKDKRIAELETGVESDDKTIAELYEIVAKKDKRLNELEFYLNEYHSKVPLGHQPHMVAHKVEELLKQPASGVRDE